MSGNSKINTDASNQPIEKAEKVIELFGGIRPMATKMSVAVTTVQGWKKRNVIPANRRNDVIKAAQENNIDISSFVGTVVEKTSQANENKPQTAEKIQVKSPKSPTVATTHAAVKEDAKKGTPKSAASTQSAKKVVSSAVKAPSNSKAAARPSASNMKPAAAPQKTAGTSGAKRSTHDELQAMTKKAARRNLMVTGSLVVAALAVGVFMFSGSDFSQVKEEVTALKTEVASIDNRTSLLESWVPKDLNKNLEDMKKEAQALGNEFGQLGNEVGQIAATLTDSNGSILERISMLEGQLANGAGGKAMQDVLARIDSLSSGLNGQQELSAAMNDLAKTVTGMQAQVDGVDAALERAKQDNDALAEALEGVTGRDLGAAAMLIALEHARSSFNRNEPFEDDLKVLQSIIGDSDPELNAAINNLAPYAEEGILTSENLSSELTSLSGDILMAKMAGEDVSVQDKALQRFNEVVKLSKNGMPVNGSEEELIIAKAQEALAKGDVEAAKAELSKLEGGAADAASTWMDKADGNLAAQNLEQVILQEVLTNVQGLRSGGLFNSLGGGGTVIDPSTGMAVQ
jgi:hypothetical protein